jgi:hypothetical protein
LTGDVSAGYLTDLLDRYKDGSSLVLHATGEKLDCWNTGSPVMRVDTQI